MKEPDDRCRVCGWQREYHPALLRGHRFREGVEGDSDPKWWCQCGHRSKVFHEASGDRR